MEPILFAFAVPHLGWVVRVQAYPLAHLLALLTLVGMTLRIYGRRVGSAAAALDVLLAAVPAALLGAVLLGAVTSGATPSFRVTTFWSGYRSAYGGLLGGTFTAWLVARLRGLPVGLLFDSAAPGVAVGAVFCRLGCFLAGCCWGRPTESMVGLRFPFDHPGMSRLPPGGDWGLHPTQLYLAASALAVGLFLLLWRRRRTVRPGTRFLLGAAAYALSVFCVEFLRADPGRWHAFGLSHNQWISIGVFAAAAFGSVRASCPRPTALRLMR
jgi:phosphatidylglycerol:prolipoprotein diacylglycerol transferase